MWDGAAPAPALAIWSWSSDSTILQILRILRSTTQLNFPRVIHEIYLYPIDSWNVLLWVVSSSFQLSTRVDQLGVATMPQRRQPRQRLCGRVESLALWQWQQNLSNGRQPPADIISIMSFTGQCSFHRSIHHAVATSLRCNIFTGWTMQQKSQYKGMGTYLTNRQLVTDLYRILYATIFVWYLCR